MDDNSRIEVNMLIKKKGTVLFFECSSCGCEFVAGIHAVRTPDKNENFCCNCPQCGAECHTDWVRQSIKERNSD